MAKKKSNHAATTKKMQALLAEIAQLRLLGAYTGIVGVESGGNLRLLFFGGQHSWQIVKGSCVNALHSRACFNGQSY
jgi:hypothetical protein